MHLVIRQAVAQLCSSRSWLDQRVFLVNKQGHCTGVYCRYVRLVLLFECRCYLEQTLKQILRRLLLTATKFFITFCRYCYFFRFSLGWLRQPRSLYEMITIAHITLQHALEDHFRFLCLKALQLPKRSFKAKKGLSSHLLRYHTTIFLILFISITTFVFKVVTILIFNFLLYMQF